MLVAYFEELDHSSSAQREIALLALELRELYESLDVIFFTNKENQVYSVRLNRAKDQMKDAFVAQPLNVGKISTKRFTLKPIRSSIRLPRFRWTIHSSRSSRLWA